MKGIPENGNFASTFLNAEVDRIINSLSTGIIPTMLRIQAIMSINSTLFSILAVHRPLLTALFRRRGERGGALASGPVLVVVIVVLRRGAVPAPLVYHEGGPGGGPVRALVARVRLRLGRVGAQVSLVKVLAEEPLAALGAREDGQVALLGQDSVLGQLVHPDVLLGLELPAAHVAHLLVLVDAVGEP